MKSTAVRNIAVHLPQFHPIPENDEWWGTGFTEWTNVTKARPIYEGHHQPHLPADLGYYDLRLAEAREAQAKLAAQYNIDGFCYYHYWFNGKRLLERPVDEILLTGKPDFPFMLCWANDNWTRRWDGLDQEILISHTYSNEDDVTHMEHLIKYFKDPRYIRVNGKPVFILYKTFLLPNPEATAQRWRQVAANHGLELYLCHMVFGYTEDKPELVKGFDAVIDFEPFGIRHGSSLRFSPKLDEPKPKRTIAVKVRDRIIPRKHAPIQKKRLNVFEYRSIYKDLLPIKATGLKMFPSLCPGWDNSARKKHDPSLILDDSTPAYFKEWYDKVVNDFEPYSPAENFIFINAWNEWAEGNHLEPCTTWGHQYLEVLKK